jgi:hypothetical protein
MPFTAVRCARIFVGKPFDALEIERAIEDRSRDGFHMLLLGRGKTAAAQGFAIGRQHDGGFEWIKHSLQTPENGIGRSGGKLLADHNLDQRLEPILAAMTMRRLAGAFDDCVQPLVGRDEGGNRMIEVCERGNAVRFRHGQENASSAL